MDGHENAITKIIDYEWEMFIAVNEGEDPASCQEDRDTFVGMRAAQFIAWSQNAVNAYMEDLSAAQLGGRNLVEEKYIHMMKTTEPSRYEALLPRVRMPSDAVISLAHEVSDLLLEQTKVLFENYPFVSGHGRPLYSTLDYASVSVETYQLGELLTYSEETLAALKEHIAALEAEGRSLAREILENTIRYYGYKTLDDAEAVTKERIEARGFELTFGCAGGCDDEGDLD